MGAYLAQSYRSPQCTNVGCTEVGPTTPLCTPAAGQNQFGCDETGVLGLHTINGIKPTTLWPLTGATKTAQINSGFLPRPRAEPCRDLTPRS